MKPVAVIDNVWKGHVPTYHKLIVQSLLEQGASVLSLSPKPLEVKQWIDLHCPSLSGRLRCYFFSMHPAAGSTTEKVAGLLSWSKQVVTNTIKKLPLVEYYCRYYLAVALWKRTNKTIHNYINDDESPTVFFPYLDNGYLHPLLTSAFIERSFDFQWSGLYLHPKHLRIKTGNVVSQECCKIFKARCCHTIAVLDEGIAPRLKNALKKKVIVFPDITNLECPDITDEAKGILSKAGGKVIVSLIGVLSKKKNVHTFLKLAKRLDASRFFFLIAGDLEKSSWNKAELDEILNFHANSPENVHFCLRTIPDGTQYNSLVKISNIIFAMYNNFYHSSNTLTKAAAFRKPVIVGDGYLMAERVNKYGIGKAVRQGDVEGCISAIEDIAQDIHGHNTNSYDHYYEMHSYNTLAKSLIDFVLQ